MAVADSPAGEVTPDALQRLGITAASAVLIVGLGKTGYSIAHFLARHGIRFAITDTRKEPPSLKAFSEAFPDAAVFINGFEASAFAAATHLIVSPGVSLDEPLIAEAIHHGVPVLGDLDLFACSARAPVIAITGSNGKSTVTTLVGLMAQNAGRQVRVGGNLGTPMLDLLDGSADLYVLELSSFQLDCSHVLEPIAATVLNISPDHLDRYTDIQAYADAKARIFHGDGLMLLNRDDPMVVAMSVPGRQHLWFSLADTSADYAIDRVNGEEWLVCRGEAVIRAGELRLQGRHNLANALAALALGDAVGLPRVDMVAALRQFSGLDHRSQWVAELHGVTWINDSKATNVGACMAALAGMNGPVVLIAGGDGKGADFTVLRPVVEGKVKAAVLMGRDAGLLEKALGDLVPVTRVNTMRQAVEAAQKRAAPGDTVLLAPACASLDQYKDYQERGRMFAEAVRSLPL
ncbi:MAG: UDP-N-acetylmuramoyl-L-alanine--D-glutamate ligase [Methylococcaceae bacterium]|jgi:UDP-N-acetylmuramoylalanine--D-glutamate ligase